MRWNRYRRDRQIIAAVLVFTVIVAAGIALQPGFHPPSSRTTGDKQLVSILTPLLNGARGQVAAALITPQGCATVCGGASIRHSMRSPA